MCFVQAMLASPFKGEVHLRRILRSYARYYNDIRTHRSLDNEAPVSCPVQRTGSISSPAPKTPPLCRGIVIVWEIKCPET